MESDQAEYRTHIGIKIESVVQRTGNLCVKTLQAEPARLSQEGAGILVCSTGFLDLLRLRCVGIYRLVQLETKD